VWSWPAGKRANMEVADTPRRLAANQDGWAARTRGQRRAVAGHVADTCSGLPHGD